MTKKIAMIINLVTPKEAVKLVLLSDKLSSSCCHAAQGAKENMKHAISRFLSLTFLHENTLKHIDHFTRLLRTSRIRVETL